MGKEKPPLSKELLEVLACPLCKTGLDYAKGKKALICAKCKARYQIESGIPILLTGSRKKFVKK